MEKPEKNVALPPARSMTRGERNAFREAKKDWRIQKEIDFADPLAVNAVLKENAEMVDWIIDNIYDGKDGRFDNVPQEELNHLADLTYRKTYGTPDAGKN